MGREGGGCEREDVTGERKLEMRCRGEDEET